MRLGGREGKAEVLQTPLRGKEGEEEGRQLSSTGAKRAREEMCTFVGASVCVLFPSDKSEFFS